MPQLLFEILTEEIPARMQAKAAADLERLVMDALSEAGLLPEAIKTFAGPRRLVAVVDGLPVKSPDVREERKGPRVGAPDKAVEGFLRGAGLASLDACETREDKKGAHYVAVIDKPGAATPDLLAEALPAVIRAFPWPKSMRWGAGSLRWVRPINRILASFDGEAVPFELEGITAGRITEGHRLMGRGPFTVRRFDDYAQALREEGHVLLDAAERASVIEADAKTLCAAQNLELVDDAGLLTEVAGLVEWPVTLMGDMDPAFLDLPPEVIQLSMRTHQKYFAVRDPATGGLAPKFIVVANQIAPDGGKAIAAGNARVLSARLNDARFFYDNDRKTPLDAMAQKLSTIEFKKELGSIADKVERVAALARHLAPACGADPDLAERAARLAKADLVSEMVYEFPELQGVMGRYYALAQGEEPAVADAIADHYRPQGPSDAVPTAPVSVAVALADKLDTLVGFWAINEKPTGSKDPFALRRAALGVVRVVLANAASIALTPFIKGHDVGEAGQADAADLLAFILDRLKVALKDEGVSHDVLDAVFALGDDDVVRVTARARALQAFVKTDDGAELLSGWRRASNIVAAEEKKGFDVSAEAKQLVGANGEGPDFPAVMGALGHGRERPPEEAALHDALGQAKTKVELALEAEKFEDAMVALAPLRPAVDAFFDAVTVNAEDPMLRRNRLLLLSQFRDALRDVADLSKLEG